MLHSRGPDSKGATMQRYPERRSTRRVLGLALAVAALLLFVPPSRAQFGMNMFMGGDPENSAPMTRKGVKQYVEILALDPDQSDAAMTLLDGYLAGYKSTM